MKRTLTPVDYERDQRHRTLTVVDYIALSVTVALGVKNAVVGNVLAVVSLGIFALFCGLSLWLNAKKRYLSAALVFCVSAITVATFNLFCGDGLQDAGIVAYPCLIILGTLLLGKRAALSFLLICLGCVASVAWAELTGRIQPEISAGNSGSVLISVSILLCSAASMIWVIMNNSEQNFDLLRDSEKELRAAYELTLEGWAKALEYRDKETEGHSRRVAEMTLMLAAELGCCDADLLHIRHGALLHDLGKIAVPDDILLKPGTLTEEERAVVEQHPVLAREMLAPIEFLGPAIDIPYSHHERWDGKGYPQGLKGEAIPYFARIFAVVDQWDALSSDRPYRKAWSPEEVIAYLQENKEVIFDPVVVDAFVGLLKRGNAASLPVRGIRETTGIPSEIADWARRRTIAPPQ